MLVKKPKEINSELLKENHRLLDKLKDKERQIERLDEMLGFMRLAFKNLTEERDELKKELDLYKKINYNIDNS